MERVTVRLDEELKKSLEIESNHMGVDKSEYIRMAIRDKIRNDTAINNISQLCKISTIYNHIIDKYEVSETEKSELKKVVELAWKN